MMHWRWWHSIQIHVLLTSVLFVLFFFCTKVGECKRKHLALVCWHKLIPWIYSSSLIKIKPSSHFARQTASRCVGPCVILSTCISREVRGLILITEEIQKQNRIFGKSALKICQVLLQSPLSVICFDRLFLKALLLRI